jgi:hypothetical protein
MAPEVRLKLLTPAPGRAFTSAQPLKPTAKFDVTAHAQD